VKIRTATKRALLRPILCALIGVALLSRGTALAQPANTAREYFAQGVEQAHLGDFDSAAGNFEKAYRLSPHYAVQYNLGQAYAALGKAIEAARAFEKYLEEGGEKIPLERQTEVRQLILASKRRIGYVAFEIRPPAARLVIDGSVVNVSRGVPVSLVVGVHGVALELAGYRTFAGSVTVESQRVVPFEIQLEPISSGAPARQPDRVSVGQVAIDSTLPALKVSLDGVEVEHSSSDPILVPVGGRRLRCERDGYAPIEVHIEVSEKGVVRVGCDLVRLPKLPPSEIGLVRLEIDRSGAEVLIDGRKATANALLPKGPHSVRVRRWGFVDWTKTITVRPGFPETVTVRLSPTPEHAEELALRASKRRTLAYVLGGTGIAFLGTSAALYVANNPRYEDWQAQRGGVSATSIQRQDDAALGCAIAGGVLLGSAVISWLGAH
jgi:hypothetical protein